ncbi:MAG: hypothetical protein Q8P41_31060 [Pseudomonadota bacterium]|nr:hypothetical protein [Pseudomonadota bacterium]
MHPTILSPNELSALTALGRMPPVPAAKAERVLEYFSGHAREVAAVLIDAPAAASASVEARAIAAGIRDWAAKNRERAPAPRSRTAVAG